MIKTGLKLSEAVKLLEENEGALIKPEDAQTDGICDFEIPIKYIMATNILWSVKLPPPKSVTVTRADVERAWFSAAYDQTSNAKVIEALCKELGL